MICEGMRRWPKLILVSNCNKHKQREGEANEFSIERRTKAVATIRQENG